MALPVDESKAEELPVILADQSLVHKHFTPSIWEKYGAHRTKSGASLLQCCAIAHKRASPDITVGVRMLHADCYYEFKEFFDKIIDEYHNLESIRATRVGGAPLHVSDMDAAKIKGTIGEDVPVISTRIRVGRNIKGFGLSPGITKEERLEVEKLMKGVFASLSGDLAGTYYPLLGMDEATRKQLQADHLLFNADDPNLVLGGMARDWPEGRGIFHSVDKTFIVWLGEEDQLRIISMQKGGDALACFNRLSKAIAAIETQLKAKGHEFSFSDDYGYIHSCPTNLGTGMRASVLLPLPNWAKKGKTALRERCYAIGLQPRGLYGEAGSHADTSGIFDVSNKYRLGYSEVELVQMMIDGVNSIWKEEQELATASATE